MPNDKQLKKSHKEIIMQLKLLDSTEISTLYQEHMVIDFPKDELKPLNMILKSVKEGFYDCFGLYDEEEMVGYTFMVKIDNSYLIDYIAIFPECRNKGIGTNLLAIIDDYLENADRILVEVEDPAYTKEKSQKELQSRRLNFYLRNNCRDTSLRVDCFGVKFIILEARKTQFKNKNDVWNLYEKFYRSFLPEDKFNRNIKRLN